MSVLFVNAAFREDSRTLFLAGEYLKRTESLVETVEVGDLEPQLLTREALKKYNEAVAGHTFAAPMFDCAKQFSEAEEIVIAAPFWNYGIPAALHAYLEMVCTQGITFDIGNNGCYHSLCKAKKLVYITTAGGFIPEKDHGFGYIKDLARVFWEIKDIRYFKAEGLDIYGTDVKKALEETVALMNN